MHSFLSAELFGDVGLSGFPYEKLENRRFLVEKRVNKQHADTFESSQIAYITALSQVYRIKAHL